MASNDSATVTARYIQASSNHISCGFPRVETLPQKRPTMLTWPARRREPVLSFRTTLWRLAVALCVASL